MQRYFVEPNLWKQGELQITGEDASHIAKVMRMSPGERIIACDNLGRAVVAELTQVSPKQVTAIMLDEEVAQSEPGCQITLVQGIPKGDKLEYIIQKGTEVGVSHFLPVDTARSIAQYDAQKAGRKLDRWRKIAKEAAEQSHRMRIPTVDLPISYADWIRRISDYDLVVVCYEGAGLAGLKTILDEYLQSRQPDPENRSVMSFSIAVCIGPEGGFASEEIDLAQRQGAKMITLGPRILRTETAGLVAASLILYHVGEMGG